MTGSSLSGTSLLNNDELESLAEIFVIVLQYYCQHTSPLEEDCFKKLTMWVGLSYTTLLINGSFWLTYEPEMKKFWLSRDSKNSVGAMRDLSLAAAKIISGAAYAAPFTGRLAYDQILWDAAKHVVNNVIVKQADKSVQAEKLLRILCRR